MSRHYVRRSTKYCYHAQHFRFSGVLSLMLLPLVDSQLPGFGAVVLTCRKPPRWDFQIRGPSLGAGIVKSFLRIILGLVIGNLLGWPSRLMIPIMRGNPDVISAMGRINSHCGVIKVEVIRAESLPATNVFGTAHTHVRLTTDGKYVAKTALRRNTLNPRFKQTFYFLVQVSSFGF